MSKWGPGDPVPVDDRGQAAFEIVRSLARQDVSGMSAYYDDFPMSCFLCDGDIDPPGHMPSCEYRRAKELMGD